MPQGKVLKLRKGLPGLKQLGRVWNRTIDRFFEKIGFRAVPADHSVWVDSKRQTFVALYVDNMLIAAPTLREVFRTKQALKDEY